MPPPPNLRVDYNPGSARAWAAGWDYATARAAIDAHLRGSFASSYQLAIDLNRHPAVIAARRQVRSAMTALPWVLRGPTRAPQRYETEAAGEVWAQIRGMLGDIADDLRVMGFAVLETPLDVVETETGPRYAVTEARLFPLACVEHGSAITADPKAKPFDPDRYYARGADGTYHLLPLPGETDGHWTVIAERVNAPHRRGAIIACDLEYVASQLARRAWAKLQNTLGKKSPIGELPAEIPIKTEAGDENPVATDFQSMLEAIGETQVAGIRPAGSKVDMLEATATTGDLLPQSVDASCRMFALALLGHDSGVTRGSTVYTDPRAQSVPEDLNRDAAGAVVASVGELLTFLARLNCAECAPITLDPQIPDSDQDMRREEVQKRRAADDAHRAAMLDAGAKAAAQLAAERAAGAIVDDARVVQVYALAGVEPPALAPAKPQGDAVYAYDLDGGIVTLNEQRAAKGLPSVPWGTVTVPEYRARVAAGWTTSPTGWVAPPA